MTVAELSLTGQVPAVPRARRFVVETLAASPDSVAADAELVVAELVTNALLHGDFPISLRLITAAHRVRIEVADEGRDMPIIVRGGSGAMSGRGLGLVTALTTRWGVTRCRPTGKVVWAELSDGSDSAEVATGSGAQTGLPPPYPDEKSREPLYTVALGAVQTDLLLTAKAHIDNLVREFTFAAAASSQTGEQLPVELAELVQTVVHGFAAARLQIKRQAAEAAERGAAETDLTLTLPASAADAGEQYLAALDVADRYARAARLLTLETPPLHRAFRRWYVEALISQLRRAAAGLQPVPVPTFAQTFAADTLRATPRT